MSELARVPHNLRRFVVEQDYEQYTEVDQAVWRFVLLQTYDRLQHTAHSAYRQGLTQTGISVERIPRISEMSDCLQRFGWHAVCVDGFIPPRAFQEFQAASILPIAADMRSQDHLTYTPAPDIIHEAAGHAPILPDAGYAAYLRAIGQAGKRAFSSVADARVDAAIFELSELKETRGVTTELVANAEARLQQALAEVSVVSEASRLSRLYWWTAEYGLVGTPRDYKLYGAGLLSSLWESHACHDLQVHKLPLVASCVEQGYDITRTQPQLFVARDFEHLFTVLEEVEATLVHRRGGASALAAALGSEELATLHFRDQRFVTGQLSSQWGSASSGVLTFRGPIGLGRAGRLAQRVSASEREYRLPLGPLAGGQSLESLAPVGKSSSLVFECGVRLEGRLLAVSLDEQGRLFSARFGDYRLSSEAAGFSECGSEYVLFAASDFETAEPGAHDPSFHRETERSTVRVPKARSLPERERRLLSLYERALVAFRERLGADAVPVFEAVHRELSRHYPDEWLLRWNLLESLVKMGESNSLSRTLRSELALLELKFAHKEPIASGLRYLGSLAA